MNILENDDYILSDNIEENRSIEILGMNIERLISQYEALICENEQLKEEIANLLIYKKKYEEKINRDRRAGRKAINFTEEDIKNMKQLNENGSSTREIAKIYGCSHTLVNKLIKIHTK